MLTGALLSVVFLAGFILRGQVPTQAQGQNNTRSEFPLLAEVRGLIAMHYLREMPPEREMEYAAVRGYLAGLEDPYTYFNEPVVAQSESDALAGQYGGIGVQVRRDEQGQFVLYPFRDGPAAAVGVQDGDVLLAIEGQPLGLDERLDVVDQMLRGEVGEGRGVTIRVRRATDGDEHEYFIEFAVVTVPSVVWRVLAEDARLGYIQIISFTGRTPDELRTALDDLKTQGVAALVLDLRNDAGGLLQESVEVASEFLDGGVVFYEQRRDEKEATYASEGGAALDQPLAVLVNGGTASAAELVAGAIRDRDRGILIGQKTYGKGSVQLIFRLSDESSIHITSAEWLTPGGTSLNGNGLEPDQPMIPDPEGRDVELGEAVRYLREILDRPTDASVSAGSVE